MDAALPSKLRRRSLLYAFGVASVSPMLRSQTAPVTRIAAVNPGGNRFAYSDGQVVPPPLCKLTSEDSAGALSIFELQVLPRSGPPRHVHHRENEWYYVISGEYIFEAGNEKHHLSAGGSIWLPREIPHVWANTADTNAKLLLICQPGGFEKFFDELGRIPLEPVDGARMSAVMRKYGMELLGPPLLAPAPHQH